MRIGVLFLEPAFPILHDKNVVYVFDLFVFRMITEEVSQANMYQQQSLICTLFIFVPAETVSLGNPHVPKSYFCFRL